MASVPSIVTKPVHSSAIPPREYEDHVMKFMHECLEEGDGYLEQQPGYADIQSIKDILDSKPSTPLSNKISSVSSNHLARVAGTLVSGLTDVRPFFDYQTHNKRYEKVAVVHNKLAESLWRSRFLDQRNADAIKYAVMAGTGYLELYWNKDVMDLDARAHDPRDVLPIRPADNTSIQNCMAVIIRKECTVNHVRHMYKSHAHRIKPDRDREMSRVASPGATGLFNRLTQHMSPFHNILFNRAKEQRKGLPSVDLFRCFMHDYSVNDSDSDAQMGDPDTNWGYIVGPGAPLYPRGRYIVFTRTAVLYDGPNPFWHGQFPLAKLTLDHWPWNWFGKSPLIDALPLQNTLDKTLRVIEDRNERVAQPGVIADRNNVSTTSWDRINTRRAGLKMMQNAMAGKGAQIIHEPPMDQYLAAFPDWLIDQMETLTGARDLSSLAQLGQMPSADTIDRIIQSMSPANRSRSRSVESYVSEIAMQTLSNLFQFYTSTMRQAALGPSGLLPEDFDTDIGNPVPDLLFPDEFEQGQPTPEALARPPRPTADRARYFLRYFRFDVAAGSLLSSAAIERQLMYLQLARAGLIDHWTLLEELGIPNVGLPPDGANSITDRLAAEQEQGLGMNISPTGRKATGQSMPRMTVKES